MNDLSNKLSLVDWDAAKEMLNDRGYFILPSFLNREQCDGLIDMYDVPDIYRKTVVMERHRFGKGSYKYWKYPLPNTVQTIRDALYPFLAPMANEWMQFLKIKDQFPLIHDELKTMCHNSGQLKPTSLILKYGEGGFNTLHQDLYGDVYFPLQAACFLNDPGTDYEGGEFILTQQVPRAQSKAMVLNPNRGDMVVFTTNFRPLKGARGYYRATMRHGVSEVRKGERHTLGIIFHDAVS